MYFLPPEITRYSLLLSLFLFLSHCVLFPCCSLILSFHSSFISFSVSVRIFINYKTSSCIYGYISVPIFFFASLYLLPLNNHFLPLFLYLIFSVSLERLFTTARKEEKVESGNVTQAFLSRTLLSYLLLLLCLV